MKAINVTITYFDNPYSFFCVINQSSNGPILNNNIEEGHNNPKKSISDVNHGQYVAVMWKNKWTRGVITMESQFLIWLIDYGFFIHPNSNTVYIELPLEYKKYPTKVFEAAIHGVIPLDKYLNDDFCINNKMSMTWNKGAIEKCQELIKASINTYLVPLALMSTKHNDIVLGDLYLEIPGKNMVNLIEELELWPIFLEKQTTAYIENLSKYYVSRRKHRACILKPEFADAKLHVVTPEITLEEYTSLVDSRSAPELALQAKYAACPSDGDTDSDTETVVQDKRTQNAYRLTPAEIEKYSNLYVTVHGVRYNVLNVLVNKARDLRMCERYKDLKSIGRGSSFKGPYRDDCF